MKNLRLLSILLTTGALALSACNDKDSGEDTSTTIGDGDEADDSTSGGEDFVDDESSGDTTGDGDTNDTNGTSGFVPETDIPSASSCDPFAQDCNEGEKCVAYASSGGTWDANKCVPINGDGQQGDPCTYADAATSTDDCGADSWCWDVNEEGMGTCTPFCTGTADAPVCGANQSCSIANEGSINLCLTTCDPLLQDCDVGKACFYDGTGFVCANATQDIPTGEPCGYINDCVAGNICLAPESFPACAGASCCGQFCDLADPDFVCQPDGTECTTFYEEGMAPPGYEDVGVCVVPA
ncbi:ribulose phosphate epimerase [Nannocystaceae bacterium ST9]